MPPNTLFHLMRHATVVPVVVVATKFDLLVSKTLFDIADGDTRFYDQARATAHKRYEHSCRSLFPRDIRDVLVETISSTSISSVPLEGTFDSFHGSQRRNHLVILSPS
jgi:hypothetical protein